VIGVVLPLLLIGAAKFTTVEIEALKPLIGGTPWIAWLYPLLGYSAASYLLGTIEIAAGLLLVAAARVPIAGVLGGALASLTFITTTSILFAVPIWDAAAGGLPALNGLGQFLLKDVALLGIAVALTGDGFARHARNRAYVE
jgi:uncharacterized membrane protein YkgB